MNEKVKSLMDTATGMVNRCKFQIKKKSPEIFLVSGIVFGVAGAVVACKATLKVDKILKEKDTTIQNITDLAADPDEGNYTDDDAREDLKKVYIRTGVKVATAYAPAIIMGFASVGCLIQSNNIMRKRNLAIAAAYATVDSSFKEYRKRVVDRFGEDVDHELKYDIQSKTFEKDVVDEDGKPTGEKITETVKVVGDHQPSDYARFFDESCIGWERNAELNLMFLNAQQKRANMKLIRDGFLFLNDVYHELGIPETIAGQSVGWIYDKDNPAGDNFVDFGIYNVDREKSRDFVNGYERSILLDFNVDGDILSIMSRRGSMGKI